MAFTYPTAIDSFTDPTSTSLLTSPSHSGLHTDINGAVEALETKVGIGNTVLGTYTAYTPTFSSGLTLGNGTLTAGYCRVNDFVHYWGRVVWGTTTSVNTSGVQVTLPVNADTSFCSTNGAISGYVACRDVSAAITFIGVARPIDSGFNYLASLSVQNIVTTYLANTAITTTVPMTWTSTDIMFWSMYYKAA